METAVEQLKEQWKMFRNFFTAVEEPEPWQDLLKMAKFYFNSHEQFRRGSLLLMILVPVLLCCIGVIMLCMQRARSRRTAIDPKTVAELQETLEANLQTLQQVTQVIKRRNAGRATAPAQVQPSEGPLRNTNPSNHVTNGEPLERNVEASNESDSVRQIG